MTTRRDDAHVCAGQGTEATLRVGEEHFCTKGLMILERNYLDVYPCALCPPPSARAVRPREGGPSSLFLSFLFRISAVGPIARTRTACNTLSGATSRTERL